jgi:hypothetical protein
MSRRINLAAPIASHKDVLGLQVPWAGVSVRRALRVGDYLWMMPMECVYASASHTW